MASPEGFWEDVASELEWMRRWDTVFQWDYPTFRWFVGAKCNITQNALDRHLVNGNRNKAAFIWLGEDGSERVFTYGRLAQSVNRFANGLRSLGVGKGDRVVIYMPLTPEGAIAMLACARIGAVHSVVYAGFSSGSLRDRITDAQAKVVITADVGYRRGNEVDLLGITERAVEDLGVVEKVILWRRKGASDAQSSLGRPRGGLRYPHGTGQCGVRGRGDGLRGPALHPLHQRNHRTAQGRAACTRRLHGGHLLPLQELLGREGPGRFLVHVGHRLGSGAQLHRLRAAGGRGHHCIPRGRHRLPESRHVLRDHRKVRRQRHIHRARPPCGC